MVTRLLLSNLAPANLTIPLLTIPFDNLLESKEGVERYRLLVNRVRPKMAANNEKEAILEGKNAALEYRATAENKISESKKEIKESINEHLFNSPMMNPIMTRNEIREIWNLPPIPNGDVATIRGEYYLFNEDGTTTKHEDDVTGGNKDE